MRVTGVHNDSLERQITEAVNIANFRGPALMNRRGELGGVRIERQQYLSTLKVLQDDRLIGSTGSYLLMCYSGTLMSI